MSGQTAELKANLTPRTVQNLNGFDSRYFRKKIFNMGYENISLYGGLAEYFDRGEMFLYVEDDAEFLIDYYTYLEELVKKPDNYEHNAYLTDGVYTLSAKSDRKIVEIKFNYCPGSRAVNLVTKTVTTSENEYFWWWRSIAYEIVNFALAN
ncbi:MAG: hypothetical protein WBA41_26345 [Rivularia sp. (in: cyanobacteria)]